MHYPSSFGLRILDRPAVLRYGAAIAAVAVTLLISLLLRPIILPNPFIFFFGAIVFSAGYGGLGPGLLATALSVVLTNFFFIPPFNNFQVALLDLLRLVAFALVAIVISSLSNARRRAQQTALAQSEQFRTTLASIGDAVIATDTAGRVTFINPVAETLTGWPATEVYNQPIEFAFRVINADSRRPVDSPVAAILRTGHAVTLATPCLLIRRDGVERPIEDSGAPIRDAEGHLIGAVLVFRDVSERERTEAARTELLAREHSSRLEAERARERLDFLADAGSRLVATLDYNATLQQIARICVPRLADWCVIETPGPDGTLTLEIVAHVDPAKEAWARELRARYPGRMDMPIGAPLVIRSGESLLYPEVTPEMIAQAASDAEELRLLQMVGYHSIVVVPLRAHGRILGSLSLISTSESGRHYSSDDVTLAEELARRAALALENATLYRSTQESRNAAEQAVERISRLQQVTAALGAKVLPEEVSELMVQEGLAAVGADAGAVYLISDDGLMWEARSFRGYPADLAPRHVRVPIDRPGPLAEARQSLQLVLVENPAEMLRRWPHLTEAQARSGDAALAAVPLLLAQDVIGVLTVAFRSPRCFSADDISFLEALGRQCAQALDRARIYAAERSARTAAEEAIQLRDRFLSIASHELKTPLTSLILQTQLLQRRVQRSGILPEREQQTIQVVVDQSHRLERMVTGLLDISRIELNQLRITTAPVDLAALIERIVAETQPTTDAHQISCTSREGPFMVAGDELRLEQVIQNLIQNAIKYSPDGGPIEVEITQHNMQACVTVRDRGIGLPEQALPQLFERFYRAPNADPRQISGLGIGLYIVREIVRLHGGTITATRRDDGQGGSCFTIHLPMLPNDAISPERQPVPAQSYCSSAT